MLLEESVASAEVVSQLCWEHDLGVVNLARLGSVKIWRHYCLRVAWMEIARAALQIYLFVLLEWFLLTRHLTYAQVSCRARLQRWTIKSLFERNAPLLNIVRQTFMSSLRVDLLLLKRRWRLLNFLIQPRQLQRELFALWILDLHELFGFERHIVALIVGVLRPCSIQTEGVVGVVTLDFSGGVWLPYRVVVGVLLWPCFPSR